MACTLVMICFSGQIFWDMAVSFREENPNSWGGMRLLDRWFETALHDSELIPQADSTTTIHDPTIPTLQMSRRVAKSAPC